MPERQFSPGDVTARPDPGVGDDEGTAHRPAGGSPVEATAISGVSGADLFTPAGLGFATAGQDSGGDVEPDESPTVVTAPAGERADAATPPEPPRAWFGDPEAPTAPVLSRAVVSLPMPPAAPAPEPPQHRPPEDQPTVRIRVAAPPAAPPAEPPTTAGPGAAGEPERPSRRRRARWVLIGGGVLVALGALYGADLALGSGSVPRGVTVVGIDVGGLTRAAAEQKLRAEITPRISKPVAVTAGTAHSTIDPEPSGLTMDWAGTVDRAAVQPLDPWTRITSFFSHREVGTVSTVDQRALTSALAQLSPIVDAAPTEGTVRFDGLTPVPVDPEPGRKLDVPAAAAAVERGWATGETIALPLVTLPPITTTSDVTTAVERVARPAVSAPVTVAGEKNVNASLAPEVIAAALAFRAVPGSGLVPELNPAVVGDALKPQLAASESPGSDAKIDVAGGNPVVVPSKDGRGVDYEATAKALVPALTATGPRQVEAVYGDQHPALTTEKINALGITGVIGEWTTGGFAADSGKNIKRAAEKINGTIVAPGATFSLNDATNPRDAAHGYVEAGIIEGGHPARGIGGGVSQVATTLYNASYFAGMVNVHHQEHSFYISRYPAGREATVFDDVIDLKFRNDNPTGVLIQAIWTPTSLTMKIFGTKRYEVTSTPGPRTDPTPPNTINIPAGQPCTPSTGAPGFTITDTRTLKEISTGQVRTENRTVHYDPSPNVTCGAPPG